MKEIETREDLISKFDIDTSGMSKEELEEHKKNIKK